MTNDVMTPAEVWKVTLSELELQMTQATFNQWLKDTSVIRYEDATYHIGVKNTYAKDWLENRLLDTLLRTLIAIDGRQDTKIAFEVIEPDELPQKEKPIAEEGDENRYVGPIEDPKFPGFEPLNQNWTQTPDMFFTYVVPNAHAVVTKIVAATIHQTLGVFEDKRRTRRRDEWPVNNAAVMRQAGIKSRTSFSTALWDARSDGYIIRREIKPEEQSKLSKKMGYRCTYTLRIRYPDDQVDYPQEERPSYGNTKRKKK